jgi:predicted nucleic acid-binding protein
LRNLGSFVHIVFNTSPLVFLAKLGYLESFLKAEMASWVPPAVADEFGAKTDAASQTIQQLIDLERLQIRQPNLSILVNSLQRKLGIGESEAIALAIELNADYVLLDDAAARREAMQLGLTVRGTLAVIRKLASEAKIDALPAEDLYQRLQSINFRIKRPVFDRIFSDILTSE